MANVNKIVRRTTQQMLSGFILGRGSPGVGPVELLDLQALRQFGIASKADAAAGGSTLHGFGFSISGRPSAGQVIGIAVFPNDITFVSEDPNDVVTSTVAATSSAAFSVQALISGVFTEVGQITWGAAGKTGTVTFDGGQYLLSAGTQLKLVAPNPQDTTLSDIAGKVVGSEA
jgi:hypothetical protein